MQINEARAGGGELIISSNAGLPISNSFPTSLWTPIRHLWQKAYAAFCIDLVSHWIHFMWCIHEYDHAHHLSCLFWNRKWW